MRLEISIHYLGDCYRNTKVCINARGLCLCVADMGSTDVCISESPEGDLLSLQWPAPPRNVFIVKKDFSPSVTESLIEFAKYRTSVTLL